MYNRYENFPKRHVVITPSDDDPQPMLLVVYCTAAGDVSVSDDTGTSYTYTLERGDILPIMPTWIYQSDTTASLVGLV